VKIPEGWSLSTIGVSCSIRNDQRKPISTEEREKVQGCYPYYGPTGVLDWIDHYLIDGEFALIGEDGDHFLKAQEKRQSLFVSGKFNVNNHAHVIGSSDSCTARWFAYYFEHRDITSFLSRQGANRFKLSKGSLERIPIVLPPLPEQKAIADTLSTWDAAIETIERLIATKEKSLAGHYQRNFSEEGIQSNGWSRVPLSELFKEVSRGVEGKSLQPYSISAGRGFVSQEEKFGRDISGAQYQNYVHLKSGEFAYNKGNSKRFQQGCIYLLTGSEIAVPNAFICFAPRSGQLVTEFYHHYFLGNCHARELRKYISSGARGDGLLNVNTDDFFQIKVPFPPIQEQTALAGAFDCLVAEIDLLRKQLELLKLQKRGLMQKLLTGTWRVRVTE
jgi:type I restriction enzyme S subunit